MNAEIDHLVVAARTLDEGVAWCEATLGITPGGGGQHALMSTHNRLFSIASAAFPRAYFEIIAIDPQAPPPGRPRWFDLDDGNLQGTLEQGPQLVHWVARMDAIEPAVAALAALGIGRGRVLEASRGALRWRISVRDDGQRLMDGALPTLIEWDIAHPAEAMPASGVALESLTLRATDPLPLQCALNTIGVNAVEVQAGATALTARLRTPLGVVTLTSCRRR